MKERMVTRTISSMVYDVMVVDTDKKSVETLTITIPSGDTVKDKEKAIKTLLPAGKLFVQIVSENKVNNLYAMSEADFIKSAKIIPNR